MQTLDTGQTLHSAVANLGLQVLSIPQDGDDVCTSYSIQSNLDKFGTVVKYVVY